MRGCGDMQGRSSRSGGIMAVQVVMGAMLQCSFGAAPSSMVVLPSNRTMAGGVPAATIMDHVPLMNIMPFGMCNSPANPMVAAGTPPAMVRFAGSTTMLLGATPKLHWSIAPMTTCTAIIPPDRLLRPCISPQPRIGIPSNALWIAKSSENCPISSQNKR